MVRSLLQKLVLGWDEVPRQDGGSTDQVQWNSVTISHRSHLKLINMLSREDELYNPGFKTQSRII